MEGTSGSRQRDRLGQVPYPREHDRSGHPLGIEAAFIQMFQKKPINLDSRYISVVEKASKLLVAALNSFKSDLNIAKNSGRIDARIEELQRLEQKVTIMANCYNKILSFCVQAVATPRCVHQFVQNFLQYLSRT